MGKLQQKLQQAVKKLSYKTTVDQLKKQGIQNVNVVGLDRIVALIEAAVHRTLKARMAGFGGVESRGAIADATREEFLKLLHSNKSLEQAREEVENEKSALAKEVSGLREQLRTVQGALNATEARINREERVRAAADDRALHREVEQMMRSLGVNDDPQTCKAIEQVMELVTVRLAGERKRVAQARRKEHKSEVDLLNRRLNKLNHALKDSESELQRVMLAKAIDPGIASIYNEVQGLDAADALYEQKRELMTSIFEANLKLLG